MYPNSQPQEQKTSSQCLHGWPFDYKCPRTDISPGYDKLTNDRAVYHTKVIDNT